MIKSSREQTTPWLNLQKLLCPICGKARATEFTPFCSRRCADVDLHRWLMGAYAVPAAEGEDGIPEDPDSGGNAR